MTESSRRRFLKTAAAGALTGGALLLPGGTAQAAVAAHHRHRHPHHSPDPGGDPGSGVGSTAYSLTVINNSTSYQDFAVYQKPVDLGVPDVLSLAWLTAPAWPTTMVRFAWTTDHDFVWSETGRLTPGVVLRESQIWDASLTDRDAQQVRLAYDRGAFTFQRGPAVGDPRPGNLYINELGNIPLGTASVGIGMSGAGTFAVQAQPNMTLVFTPHPEYWLTAGTFEAGQALDIDEITNSTPLDFGSGTNLTATFNRDNTWTVGPGSSD